MLNPTLICNKSVLDSLQLNVVFTGPSAGFEYSIEPSDGGKDLFVHMSSIVMEGYKTLAEDQDVEYEIGESDRGPIAKNVVPK